MGDNTCVIADASNDMRARLMSPACKDLLQGLDPEQYQGAVSGGGLTIIEAGAGTGKTRTLITRIAALLEVGVVANSIVAMTFTNDAARQMRSRAQAMGAPGTESVRISTIHAFAARLLRKYWVAAGLNSADFVIADPDERREIVARAVDTTDLLGPRIEGEESSFERTRRKVIKEAGAIIDRWKENGLCRELIQDPGREQRSQEQEAYAQVYLAYQDSMKQHGLVDFGDLLATSVVLLESNPSILEHEAQSISWLLVDEGQDLNRMQIRLVRLLASHGANVTVVGDDDQSLYSWRGSIPGLMAKLHSLLPDVAARGFNKVRLVTNYRCTDQILVPANLLVDYNPRAEPKVLRSGRNGVPVAVLAYASSRTEAVAVSLRVQSLIAAGTPPEEIAVLVRNRLVAEEISNSMIQHRIPHVMQAGTSLLERREVMDVLAYLKLAVDPAHALAFQRIASKPTRGLGVSAVKAVLDFSHARDVSIHDSLSAMAQSGGLKGPARLGSILMARHLSSLATAYRADADSQSMLRFVMDEIGYLAWAQTKDAHDSLDSSTKTLYEMAYEQPRLIELLTDMAVSGVAENAGTGGVHVGTMHGAKGLEWDYVFLPGFENDIIPSLRSIKESQQPHDSQDPWCSHGGGGLVEERCIAHVGFTRARLGLVVSFCGNRVLFGKPTPSRASSFLHEAELPVPSVPWGPRPFLFKGKTKAKSARKRSVELW